MSALDWVFVVCMCTAFVALIPPAVVLFLTLKEMLEDMSKGGR